jgi:hypothetical protein
MLHVFANPTMLCFFGRKIFYRKYFLYFSVFGTTENDGQRKSFCLIVKASLIFKKLKLFSKFKLFILTHTFVEIRHHWRLEFVGSPNLPLKVLEFWYPIDGIRLAKFLQNRPEFGWCQNPAHQAIVSEF